MKDMMLNNILIFIKKILIFLNKNKDKQLHFFYIAFFTRIYNLLWSDPTVTIAIATSFILMLVISILKQYFDEKVSKGHFDYCDILWGILGWAGSTIITILRIFEYNIYLH